MEWDYGAKRHYRRCVWNEFARRLKNAGARPADVYCLLMPGADGDEVEVAKAKGFREEHLCLVDQDPAIVAALAARFPLALPFAGPVDAAFGRAVGMGIPIVVVNLDLCANISLPLLQMLRGIARLWRPTLPDGVPYGLIAVTVLRGRERLYVSRVFQQILSDRGRVAEALREDTLKTLKNENDLCRVMLVWSALSENARGEYAVGTARVDTYQSIAGHQTLLWTVHELWKKDEPRDEVSEILSARDRDPQWAHGRVDEW